jgi:hypothetical protein
MNISQFLKVTAVIINEITVTPYLQEHVFDVKNVFLIRNLLSCEESDLF